MSQKTYLFLCLLTLLIVSGCIDKTQTQAEKAGWDQAKYEEYSDFYNRLTTGNISDEPAMFEIDVRIQELQGGTEFDKTWYLVFYNYYKGIETKLIAMQYHKAAFVGANERGYLKIDPRENEYWSQSKAYFDKSKEYRRKIEEWNPSNPTPKITPTSKMEFVLIPAGEFDMGSPSHEAERWEIEDPVHHVKISKAFYMGKYEVTQKQWRDVMGNNPSSFEGDDLPVETVSWNEVQDFIKKLNEKEGSNKYRLPTEAEWEYAVRAGTTTPYSFGDDESKLGDYAWYYGNSGSKTHEVGQKKPNPWGLYDMHGNVWEWVQDKWHNNYSGAPTDGSAWEDGASSPPGWMISGRPSTERDGSYRVFRGCSMGGWAKDCRSANRFGDDPARGGSALGFRLVRDV